jgi:hypothetical protein
MSKILTDAIFEAMQELENCPTGGIGREGPTVEDLDRHVEETGGCWDDDAGYHTVQRAWRLLDDAITRYEFLNGRIERPKP